MIRVDNISFGFTAVDEQFTYGLYANWDNFCHACVEKVVEECLSVYDKEKVLHEIELLDLDLGDILEEDFYQEFPRRLRDKLQRALPLLNISAGNREESTGISRLQNLLFYLEYGYPKAEWSDESFNLAEELEWIATQSSTCINKISKLCLNKENALQRLFWQADNEEVFLRLYVAALSEPAATLHEKRRFLVRLLVAKPDIPIRFIHEAENDTALLSMAELLDTISVQRIMEVEAGEHAEVDLPPYWHYLYEWLIRYYPFNGLVIFGDKSDFIRHLHHRLLTFIHKQTYSFYFSKAELTVGFLLEVFGSTDYIEVLNAIYDQQPHNPDGSPMHDSYFNRELYRIFLNLSLLRLPLAKEGKEIPSSEKEENRYPADISTLAAFLKDTQRSDTDKRILITLYAKKNPEKLTHWLQTVAVKEDALISTLTEITSMAIINQLLVSISFTAMAMVEQMRSYLQSHAPKIDWLNVVTSVQLDFTIRKAVLLWIGNGCQGKTEADNIRQLLRWIYRIITDTDNEDAIELVTTELCLAEKSCKDKEHRKSDFNILQTLLESCWNTDKGFINWLEDTTVSQDSKRELLQKMAVEKPLDWIHLLRKQPKESKMIPLLSADISVSQLLQSITRVNFYQASVLLQTMQWIQDKIDDYPFLTRGSMVLSTAFSQALLLYMQDTDTLGKRSFTKEETEHKFLSYLYLVYTGKSNRTPITQLTETSNMTEGMRSFAQPLPTQQEKTEVERKETTHIVKQILNVMEERSYFNEEEQREVPNNFFITNAGLCLFNPWFPRLFVMLDYLDKDKKAFKDTASQIRAVFLLQYLTCLEEKTYQEMELVFNRLLVNLPMHIPLPKQLELTQEEKDTAESLIKAVKANWRKMDGTSMRGFQETFIHRNGRLEQQKEKWLLTIEERGYDILLESVPWSFKQIRYPWLENYIQIIWHDKQTF